MGSVNKKCQYWLIVLLVTEYSQLNISIGLTLIFFFYLVGTGIASLVVSLVIWLCATSLGLLGNDLSLKERLFIAIAWSPKATVQVCKK